MAEIFVETKISSLKCTFDARCGIANCVALLVSWLVNVSRCGSVTFSGSVPGTSAAAAVTTPLMSAAKSSQGA